MLEERRIGNADTQAELDDGLNATPSGDKQKGHKANRLVPDCDVTRGVSG